MIRFDLATRYAVSVAIMYAAIFTIYGLQLPYLGVWLESRDLSPAQIGLIISLAAVLRLFVNPVVALWADARGRHAALVVTLCTLGLIGAALMPLGAGWWLLAGLVALAFVPLQSALPFVEVIAMRGVRQHGHDYGRVRLWGSLAFIAATFGGGVAIERLGAGIFIDLLIAAAVFAAVAAVGLAWVTRAGAGPTAGQSDRRLHRGGDGEFSISGAFTSLRELAAVPGLVWFFAGVSAIQASHATYYAFSAIHWTRSGFSGDAIGALWALGVLAEIALFAASGQLVARLGPLGLLFLGGLAGAIRWAFMALDPGFAWLLPLQILHALSFGATHLAAIHFIAQSVPPRRAGMAQTLSSTLTMGVAMAAAFSLAGILYEMFAAWSYLAMAALAAAGILAGAFAPRTGPAVSSPRAR